MTNPIGATTDLTALKAIFDNHLPTSPSTTGGQLDFQQLLLQSLDEVAGMEHAAEAGIQQKLLGEEITNVEVLTAVKKADLTLRLMLQIRNKVLEAYSEIKQMRL